MRVYSPTDGLCVWTCGDARRSCFGVSTAHARMHTIFLRYKKTAWTETEGSGVAQRGGKTKGNSQPKRSGVEMIQEYISNAVFTSTESVHIH